MDREITPYDFEIISAVISAERLTFVVDLARVVAEINIFEHIDKPFLTGNILFNDNSNLYNEINWQGTETLELEIRAANSDFATLKRKFKILSVKQSKKSNDQNETFLIDFIDEQAYESSLINVQSYYEGTSAEIIEKIVFEHLGLNVLRQNKPASHKPMRVIIPNMTPIQAAVWVKDRAPDIFGSPYFLYASLADKDLRYIDLETILEQDVLNPGQDYIFAQAFGSKLSERDFNDQAYAIQTYKQPESENMLKLVKEGYVGAQYNFMDTTRGGQYEIKHDINKSFRSMVARNVFPFDQNKPVYDAFDGMHLRKSREINQIATSRTYTDWEAYSNLYEAEEATYHQEKITQKALRNFLLKSPIDINVPGYNFLLETANMTIGNTIGIQFPINDDAFRDLRDHKRSGKYMIYAARHVFTANRYTVNLTCARLSTGRETEQQ